MTIPPKKINDLLTYTIRTDNNTSQATIIPEFGGILSSIIMKGKEGPRELLFQHKHFWDPTKQLFPGGAPFCFPICGRLERNSHAGQYLYDGHLYQLPMHGFAWTQPWVVDNHSQDSITISLKFNTTTLIHYPFQFKVTLHYKIMPNKLTCQQTYLNCGDKQLPYNAGFHPYFLTSLPNQGKEQTQVHIHAKRCLLYNQALTDIIGEQKLLDFPTSITNPAINEQLFKLSHNKSLSLIHNNGDHITMHANGIEDPDLFPYLQLYTIAEQPFICIEPWMGTPNAINTAQGMRWLAPDQHESGHFDLSMQMPPQ